jgi:hypothetical protein
MRERLNFGAIHAAKLKRRDALNRMMAGQAQAEADTDEPPATVPGFDGGARRDQPEPTPSHGAWLAAVIATRKADAGGSFEA